MTSTRWRTAAHGATGRLHSRFAGNARLGAAASVGCPEQEPRLRTATVESARFLKTLARTTAGRISFAERTDARAQAIQGGQPHPVASDSRVGGDDAQTRFVMDFSQKIDLRAFTLADPYCVVIDLPQVTFNLPPKTGETGRGLVKAF